jgi:enoyl-CoA hydratase
MQLAVACDLRVAAPSAKLSIPGGKLGILLSPTNIWRLGVLVGQGLARDFLLTGREVTGTEAQQLGLVQRVSDDPVSTALELAAHIGELAPLTVRGHKRALNLVAASMALELAARAAIDALEVQAFASDDLREGMAAFAEKRPPKFRGR